MSPLIVKTRDSLLTTSSGYTNYRGLLNLIIILLFLSNARAALENIIKYGILVDPLSWLRFMVEGSKHWPALLICVASGFHGLLSLAIEMVIANQWQAMSGAHHNQNGASKSPKAKLNGDRLKDTASQTVMVFAQASIVVNLVACLTLPAIAVISLRTHPISASGCLMLVAIVFLKLVSYHMMNYWSRDIRKDEKLWSKSTCNFMRSYVPPRIEHDPEKVDDKDAIRSQAIELIRSKYPENICLKDFAMFLMYPTLCYEFEFARTQRIRKRFLFRRVVELIILTQLDMALVQQWIVPTVSNSVVLFRQMQVTHMIERLLKLAIPNHVIWIIWFYLFFHSLLNIQAELTRFADREFYRDWWNSESVYYFWSHWNVPVHKWCVRHLYLPLMAVGLTKCQSKAAVFFVSAFFHEYLVSVPLKMFRIWAFTGMLMQLPWARFVSTYFNNNAANIAVWLSLILGQPLCILMYYHDYYVINHLIS